jgi:hypothetical protein
LRGDVVALEEDLAFGDVLHAQDGQARGRLAAARFADEAERFAAVQGERHAVDGLHRADLLADHRARVDGEVDLEVLDAQQRVGLGGQGCGAHGFTVSERAGTATAGSRMQAMM